MDGQRGHSLRSLEAPSGNPNGGRLLTSLVLFQLAGRFQDFEHLGGQRIDLWRADDRIVIPCHLDDFDSILGNPSPAVARSAG